VWNIRTKTPNNPAVTVPWHQDTAYLNVGSEKTLQPTAWIPLIDANLVNGCMQVYESETTQTESVCKHHCCSDQSWYIQIEEKDLEATLGKGRIVTCEVPLGGFLLLNQLIPHRSMENYSNKIRWSVDLRWQDPNKNHGFFGIKEPILMRTKDPNFKPDWNSWLSIVRNKRFEEKSATEKEWFKPIITGPWMGRWEITHHTPHSIHFKPGNKSEWEKA